MANRLVVAAKWFLNDEQDVDKAEHLLASFLAGDIELHAPRVFTYEVCALISKAHGNRAKGAPRISDADAVKAVEALYDLEIQITDFDLSAALAALGLSMSHSKTFKDMAYLHLAQVLNCEWCTADKKILEANKPSFPADRVAILSERPASP